MKKVLFLLVFTFGFFVFLSSDINSQDTTGRIQMLKIDLNASHFSVPVDLFIDGQNVGSANPYVQSLTPGRHTIKSAVPDGYQVRYSVCINCIIHTYSLFESNTEVIIDIPQDGFVDIWWQYLKPSGKIQGMKINDNGTHFDLPSTIMSYGALSIPPDQSAPVNSNPYFMDMPEGKITTIASVPDGYTVSWSVCKECIDHPDSSYIKGNVAEVDVSSNGFTDLWWKYTPTAITNGIFKMFEAALGQYYYAYAPSLVKINDVYHTFFCSFGETSKGIDYIRYATSSDGKNWSTPEVVLKSLFTNHEDSAACDPSVVFFEGFYYLYYSDQIFDPQANPRTVIQVARSENINGPYMTYTKRDTWENTPLDPKPIIYPFNRQIGGYGAGQQQVVVKDNQLYMWYNDDSLGQGLLSYMITSTNPVSWTPDPNARLNISEIAHSPDIKFDLQTGKFLMVKLHEPHTIHSSLSFTTSTDGITWDNLTDLISEDNFPNFAHNNGIVSDEAGNILPGKMLIAFAAPYQTDRSTDSWGYWDLYGVFMDIPRISPVVKPGDANNDGDVDNLDYNIWLDNYGKTTVMGYVEGDFDNNTKIDGTDYITWLDNYGN